MQFPALVEAESRLEAKQKELAGIFAEAGPDLDMSKVKSISGDSAAKVAHIRAVNAELDALGEEVEGLRGVAKAAERSREHGAKGVERGNDNGARGGDTGGRKSFGQLVAESAAVKSKSGAVGPVATLDVELKALFDSTSWAPETTRTGRVVEFATRPLQVVDLFPTGTTTQNAVVYMEETTFTNNAAEIAEGGPYPESRLGLTEKTLPVAKVGTWLPITDEMLEDEPRVRSYIDNRLPFMVRQRLDSQLLVGNGTAPNMRGLLNTTGIQTQAKGGDPVPDAVYKALVKVKTVGQAMPNAIVLNPLDWQDIRLLRTTDGIYIWGSPSEAGPARMWGLPVAEAQGLTENTGVVGDFANFSELVVRRGIDVQITNSHADFFVNGKQAIRADIRAVPVFYRPAAFATVTGI